MPPTDASADAGTAPITDIGTAVSLGARNGRIAEASLSADSEDTLDMRLPDELVALFADDPGAVGERMPSAGAVPSPLIQISRAPTICWTTLPNGGRSAHPQECFTLSPCGSSATSRSLIGG